ncbi:MAG TPA: hypothetical protein VGQ77_08325 [Methylomirabilota bacterium]|nr:hypothetical protein [Methylomirabilota bacterium]
MTGLRRLSRRSTVEQQERCGAAARATQMLLVGAMGGVALWLGWRSLGWPLIHDAPIMHYVAWRIAEGAAPYRDVFDMNFPGVYVIHLAILRWLGPGDAAWRAVDLGATLVTALAVAALAAPWGRAASLGGACFFTAYHLAGGAWNAGQRDFFLCPFLLAGALGVVRWAEGAGTPSLLLSGLALGAGLTIKAHAVVFVAALAALVVLRARRRGVSPLPAVVALLAGTTVAPAATVAWIAAVGALDAWREIVFGYLVPLYSQLSRPADWFYFRWHAWIAIIAAVGLTVGHLAWARRFTARHAVVVIGLAYGLIHFVAQRKGWEYHLYPLAAFAAVLLFAGLGSALTARRWLAGVPIVASVVAVVWLLGVKGSEASDSDWLRLKAQRVAALGEDLAARTRPGDLVQVFDTTDGGAHALLRGRLIEPTRFVYDFHFYHHVDAPMIQRLRGELIQHLKARPPALVVLLRAGWPAGGYERLDRFPALKEWLARGYHLAHEGDGYRIYAKRHDS